MVRSLLSLPSSTSNLLSSSKYWIKSQTRTLSSQNPPPPFFSKKQTNKPTNNLHWTLFLPIHHSITLFLHPSQFTQNLFLISNISLHLSFIHPSCLQSPSSLPHLLKNYHIMLTTDFSLLPLLLHSRILRMIVLLHPLQSYSNHRLHLPLDYLNQFLSVHSAASVLDWPSLTSQIQFQIPTNSTLMLGLIPIGSPLTIYSSISASFRLDFQLLIPLSSLNQLILLFFSFASSPQDTGPLNCACLYRFCLHLHGLLEDASLSSRRIIMYSSEDPDKRANSALLMALYCVSLLIPDACQYLLQSHSIFFVCSIRVESINTNLFHLQLDFKSSMPIQSINLISLCT